VNKTYRPLRLLFDDQLGHELVEFLAKQDPLPRWLFLPNGPKR